jgi:hypothetical protein
VGQEWKKNREFKKTPGQNKMGNIKRFICVRSGLKGPLLSLKKLRSTRIEFPKTEFFPVFISNPE